MNWTSVPWTAPGGPARRRTSFAGVLEKIGGYVDRFWRARRECLRIGRGHVLSSERAHAEQNTPAFPLDERGLWCPDVLVCSV